MVKVRRVYEDPDSLGAMFYYCHYFLELFERYFSCERRLATNCKRPFLEPWSLRWALRWSVSCLIRSFKSATCTWLEPVSFSCVLFLLISVRFFFFANMIVMLAHKWTFAQTDSTFKTRPQIDIATGPVLLNRRRFISFASLRCYAFSGPPHSTWFTHRHPSLLLPHPRAGQLMEREVAQFFLLGLLPLADPLGINGYSGKTWA